MALSRLIVNADDFGISNAVNRAILESMECGLVTSTSMMANMPGFDDAVVAVHEHAILAGKIGVHLNLTEGRPLSRPILDCPAFCNGRGGFVYKRQRPMFRLSRREKTAVYEEMKKQLEKVLAAGINPTHLDSHHHIHTEWAIAPLVCRLGREYGVTRIRLTRNMGEVSGLSRRIYKKVFNRWRIGNRRNFQNTDLFGDIEDWKAYTRHESVEGKSIEIMVHPLFDEAGSLIDLDRKDLHQQLESILEQPALCISPTDPRQ